MSKWNRPRLPNRQPDRPTQAKALAVVVLLLSMSAGLLGCTASWQTSPAKLDVPSVLYVARHTENSSTLDIGIAQKYGDRGSGHYTVAFDATDLGGVAVLKPAQDRCPVRLPTFRCDGQLLAGGDRQSFRVNPVDTTRAGDSAVLRYRLTSPGLPAVTATTRIIIGKPALAVEARADHDSVTPGGQVTVSLTLHNTGDVPARGVALFIDAHDGLRMAGEHRNCLYRGAPSAWCRLPADDVVIPPGASFHLAAPEAFTLADDATYPTVHFEAAGLGADYVPPRAWYRSGQGSALRFVPGADQNDATDDARESEAPHARSDKEGVLEFAVHSSSSDLVALADTARGPVGSRADVHIGVRNDGPGALPAKVKVEFTVPAGTTVVSSPYEFERDEELLDQDCQALAPDGFPLAETSARQPSARRYVCTAQAGKAGTATTFPFTLRIDKEMAHRGGRVTVADGDIHHPSNDPKTANDSAAFAVSVWPGPAWATPGLYAAAGIALGTFVLAAALTTWRRRRTR